MNLPLNPSAALFVAADLDLSLIAFYQFLARLPSDVVVGNMQSKSDNPLALWVRQQVLNKTCRQDWLVGVTRGLVDVIGPTEAASWHTTIIGAAPWMREWWDWCHPRRNRQDELTVKTALWAVDLLAQKV